MTTVCPICNTENEIVNQCRCDPDNLPTEPKHIILITVEGGVIQDISDIPPNVVVQIHDYDVEGIEEDKLRPDARGDLYYPMYWESNQ